MQYKQEAGGGNMDGYYIEIILTGVTNADEDKKDLIIEKFNELSALFSKKEGLMSMKAQLNIMSESEVLASINSDDTFN
jgi:hypothetical protein